MKLASPGLILICGLCTTLSGCGSGTDEAAEGREKVTPTPILEALYDRVDAGQWTLEDGIIQTLRVVAGEQTAADVYGEHAVRIQELTGLVREAEHYLRVGTDSTKKEEIRRLLALIVPDLSEIERSSRPPRSPQEFEELLREVPEDKARDAAPAKTSGRDTVQDRRFASIELVSSAAAQGTNCRRLWQRDYSVGDVPSTACFDVVSWHQEGKQLSVYYPSPWTETRDRSLRQVKATISALRHAVTSFRRAAANRATIPAGDVAAILGSYPGSTDLAWARVVGDCMIVVSALGMSQSEGPFMQTIAHEVFHCVQGWAFPQQYNGPEGRVIRWWVEGSAEYFGNVAFPHVNDEWGWVAKFDLRSPRATIMEMAYENTIFFQYLGNEIGNPKIFDLIHSLPVSGDLPAQAMALAAFPGMQDLFHRFGRDYLDQAIADTGGGVVRSTPRLGGLTTIREPKTYPFRTRGFRLTRRRVRFAGGWRHEIRTETEGEVGEYAAREPPDSSWAPFPPHALNDCDGRDYLLLVTSAGNQAHTLRVIVEGDPPRAGPRTRIDRCLVGRWVLDGDLFDFISAALPESLKLVEVTTRGRREVCFTEQGVTYGRLDGFEGVVGFELDRRRVGRAVPKVELTVTIDGTENSLYSADGGSLQVWDFESDGRMQVMVKQGGTQIVRNANPLPPLGPVAGLGDGDVITYRCKQDRLELHKPVQDAPPVIYHRVRR